MLNRTQYEQRIFQEINFLPEAALPKIMRLLVFIREEFIESEVPSQTLVQGPFNHSQTQQLLATSVENWAQEIIQERAERR